MKKIMIIIIIIIFISIQSYASEISDVGNGLQTKYTWQSWTWYNTVLELTFVGFIFIDYQQTYNIVILQPEKHSEKNPILGEHPSLQNLQLYMVSCIFIHSIISFFLPPIWREIWQCITIMIEFSALWNNARIEPQYGFGLNFRL